jgi:hypothetical protein
MRYYFHLRIGQELNPDDLGMELPDLDSAYLEAFQAAQDMWTELLAQRSDPLIRSFEIADERGRLLLTLPFVEVLDRARRRPMQLPQQVRSARLSLRGLGRSPILCGKRSARRNRSSRARMRQCARAARYCGASLLFVPGDRM